MADSDSDEEFYGGELFDEWSDDESESGEEEEGEGEEIDDMNIDVDDDDIIADMHELHVL